MDFRPIVNNSADMLPFIAIGLVFVGMILLMLADTMKKDSIKATFKKSLGSFVGGFMLVSGVASLVVGVLWDAKTEIELRENFEYNITQKYDVDDVVLSKGDYRIGVSSPDRQEILVRIDDQFFTYDLTQNVETGEPTLTDPVPLAGNPENTAPSADELLKGN